jgi:DNA invertase Pin-like site-specific DNA recombinase
VTAAPPIRCAIYTRKSSDEGLEQSFNSLHAQRQACEAYVQSQAGEGWTVLPDHYDDGGYSGGAMDRPALRRLLAEVAAKRVEVVLVYKVDRLTCFLPDFARIVDALDKAGVSFVSVTQQFNTTTSMGRLTLNVLLSFAQFEREVTGERIRDKIAASKAKGMWMGGMLPLGYDAPTDQTTRALVVNVEEAETVRLIFRRFLELGTSRALQLWLEREGIRSKRWVSTRGRLMGGYPFSRGALLPNRTYLGETPHKGASYPGRHDAIVDRQTFDAAQALLASNSRRRREHVSRADRMLLNGLVFDADGQPMVPIIAGTLKRPYRYYGSAPVLQGGLAEDRDDAIRRVPATALEPIVVAMTAKVLGSADGEAAAVSLRSLIGRVEVHPSSVQLVVRIRAIPGKPTLRATMESLRERLSPGEHALIDPSHAGLIRVVLPTRLVVRGGRTWVARPDGHLGPNVGAPDRRAVKALRSGHAVLRKCGVDPQSLDTSAWRQAAAPQTGRDRWLAQLAFLAPDIQRALLLGDAAKPWNDREWRQVPLSWTAQRAIFMARPAALSRQATS